MKTFLEWVEKNENINDVMRSFGKKTRNVKDAIKSIPQTIKQGVSSFTQGFHDRDSRVPQTIEPRRNRNIDADRIGDVARITYNNRSPGFWGKISSMKKQSDGGRSGSIMTKDGKNIEFFINNSMGMAWNGGFWEINQ